MNDLLQDSDRLAKLTAFLPGMVYQFQMHPDGRLCFPYASQAMRTLFEVAPEDVRSDATPVIHTIHPDDRPTITESILESARTLSIWHRQFRVIHKDGSITWLEGQSRPERLEDRSILWHGFVSDITDRKAAQDQVVKVRDQLNSILNCLPEVIYSVSLDRKIQYFISSATQSVYGMPVEAFLADHDLWAKMVHPEDSATLNQALSDLFRSGSCTMELRIVKPDGSIGWINDHARIIRDPAGNPTRIDGVVSDISDRVRAAQELRKARDIANAASQHKSEFLASMSHEIRTPMTAILGYSHLLTSGHPTPSEQAQWSRNIRQNSDYLLNLLSDILDISKIEAGQIELQPEPLSPWDLVQGVVSLLGPRAQEKLLDLEVTRFGPTPAQVNLDATRLKQILVNLVSNAIKFTDKGSVNIEMSSEPDPDGGKHYLVFLISDTGIGIDPDKIHQLFKPFARINDSTPSSTTAAIRPGTGLGLVIAAQFARMMGGHITVESVPGQGSRFTVKIDAGNSSHLHFVDDSDPHPAGPNPASDSLSPDTLSGMRILVTDDNPDNQRIIKFIVEQAGALVELASHGDEATHRILEPGTRSPIDLVLMDMQMPICDGYTATRLLRSHGLTLPIIALTAYTMAGDRQKCLDAGCTSYLTKPVVPDALIQEVAKHTPPKNKQNTPLSQLWAKNAPLIQHPRPEPAPSSGPSGSNKTLTAMLSNPRYARLVKEYITGLDESRTLILNHLQNSDHDALRVLAHRLKGSGTSYGFPEITKAGADCEAAIKNGQSPQIIRLLAEALINEINQARQTPEI
jgi:PAS domain S-box-containing protein